MPSYTNVDRSKPLMVVVDTSVFIHKLHQSIPMEHNDPQFESILKANLTWLMSGVWLGQELQGLMQSMVFVQDSKPYWRAEWLRDLKNTIDIPKRLKKDKALQERARAIIAKGEKHWTEEDEEIMLEAYNKLTIAYKAGRSLPEYKFTKIKKLVRRYLDQLGAKQLFKANYEADDQAAALVQYNTEAGNPWNILLLTVDTDWMGLVNQNVTWCCMSGFSPTVRDSIEVCNAWSEKRLKSSIENWRDIWDIKGQKGDASDNLPASNGVLMPVIDLLNPPYEHKLWVTCNNLVGSMFTLDRARFDDYAARVAAKHLIANGLQPINKVLPEEFFDIWQQPEPLFDLTDIDTTEDIHAEYLGV